MKKQRHRVWDYMRVYSPALCRLMARRYRGRGAMPVPMTYQEIADKAKLKVGQVVVLSTLTTWDTVTFPVAVQYIKACGMDFASGRDMHRARVLISQGSLRKLTFLKKSPIWETELKPSLVSLASKLR